MRLVWLTDIHLNFLLSKVWFKDYYEKIISVNPDAVVITGDIGESGDIPNYLSEMYDVIKVPIYFVLGNHDYYGGTVEGTRLITESFSNGNLGGTWLSKSGIIKLSERVCLIGHDSWCDGRNGDYSKTKVIMNDYLLIEDFRELPKGKILTKIQTLADEAAKYIKDRVHEALQCGFEKIVIAMHIPPFPETSWHNGSVSNNDFLPFYSSKVMGETLFKIASENKDIEFLVLCGHTHSDGESQILPNLMVLTGRAQYYYPEIQGVIEVDDFDAKFKNVNKILYDEDEEKETDIRSQINYEIETHQEKKTTRTASKKH